MRSLLASALVVAFATIPPSFAAPGWEDRVPDVCDGVLAGHDVCSDWIASLWSDIGRCCDRADAIDALWESSKTSESGYAVNVDGQWLDVSAKAAHMRVSVTGPDGSFNLVSTNNKAGKTLV